MNIRKNTSSEKQNLIHERSFCGMVLRAQIKAPICTFSKTVVLAPPGLVRVDIKTRLLARTISFIVSCHYSTCALSAAPRIAVRCGRRRRCTVALVDLPVLTGLFYNVTRKRVVPRASLSCQVKLRKTRRGFLGFMWLCLRCSNMTLGQGRLEGGTGT